MQNPGAGELHFVTTWIPDRAPRVRNDELQPE
jgi:hypothetical protein